MGVWRGAQRADTGRVKAKARLLTYGALAALWIVLLGSGCSTPALRHARTDFYAGRLEQAEDALNRRRFPRRDRVLFLMERGAILQAQGDWDASSDDFIAAHDRLVELETRSISRGAGSLVINDAIRDFVGAPFERTLLHAMTAHNHLALGHWDNAAVEARRILQTLSDDHRRNYPDEPYARYLAGLAFELIDDPSNAALQYRRANDLLPHVHIDPDTGRLGPPQPPADENIHGAWPVDATPDRSTGRPGHDQELIVALQLGRTPAGSVALGQAAHHLAPLYAEIHINGEYAGRTYNLSDTAFLRAQTERVRVWRDAARTVTRIAIKESIAVAAESGNNEWAGDLVRFILIGLLEQPDDRRWLTLPRWFQVARVPAPADLSCYTVVVKNRHGQTLRRYDVETPIQRRRQQWVSVHREVGSF